MQVNGKRRGEIRAPAGAAEEEVRRIALDDADVARHLEGLNVRKVIVVKDRIVNIVAGLTTACPIRHEADDQAWRLSPWRLAVLACAAPLAGCGFTPLYATPAVSPALASIDPVLTGTSRTGFLLKEQLNQELVARPRTSPPTTG